MPGWVQQLPLVPCDLAFGPLARCIIGHLLSSSQAASGFDDLRTKDREFLLHLHLELSSRLFISEPSLDIACSATHGFSTTPHFSEQHRISQGEPPPAPIAQSPP